MEPGFSPYIRRQADLLSCEARLEVGQRILEVGCGMGRHTFYLSSKGFRMTGLDLSPRLLERLRRFDGGRYGVETHCADVLSCPTEWRNRFDAVIGFFVLHHFHDLHASFQAMAPLVKPGGTLAFVEPNPWNVSYYVQIALTPGMSWKGDRGIRRMTWKRIKSAMIQAGLVSTSCREFGLFPPCIANLPGGITLERILESFPLWHPFLAFQLFMGRRP